MSELKIESARRQLGTALALYLDDRDPVAVHCLALGACELLDYHAKKAGGSPFTSHILKTTPDIDIGKIYSLQRKYWNAFKHATTRSGKEREDEELLQGFSDHQNDVALFIGWSDYLQVAGMLPIEAQVQQIWYIALNPERLAPEHSFEPYERTFPNLAKRPRAVQKSMLRQMIEHTRADREVMSDPRTDIRALILDWKPPLGPAASV
jgi:hypothetical protein